MNTARTHLAGTLAVVMLMSTSESAAPVGRSARSCAAYSALLTTTETSTPDRALPAALRSSDAPHAMRFRGVGLHVEQLADRPAHFGWARGRLVVDGSRQCVGTQPNAAALGLTLSVCSDIDASQDWQWKNKWVQTSGSAALGVLQNEASSLVLTRITSPAASDALALRPFDERSDQQRFMVGGCRNA